MALEVEVAGAGLAAAGGVGDLHVRRAVGELRDRGVEVVAVGGEVVEVEQEADIGGAGRADVVDDRDGVGGGAQRVRLGAAHRLHEHGRADPVGSLGSHGDRLAAELVLLLRRGTLDPVAEEGVERAHPEALTDADGHVDVVAELLDAVGDGQHPAVGAGQVAGEEVEADELHARVLDRPDQGVDVAVGRDGLVRPGPPELDGVETRRLGRRRSLEQRQLGEQDRAVHLVAQSVVGHGTISDFVSWNLFSD